MTTPRPKATPFQVERADAYQRGETPRLRSTVFLPIVTVALRIESVGRVPPEWI